METTVIKRRGRPPGSLNKTQDLKKPELEELIAQTVPLPIQPTKQQTQTPQQQRKFQTQKEFLHDLFKLTVSKLKKNIAIDGQQPDYVDIEHVHFFHTITSDGKPQTRTNSVAGHFHKIKITPTQPGHPPIVECASGPLKEVVKLQYGKRIKTEVPFDEVDTHTHTVEYHKSNVILERVKNMEAAKAEAEITSRFQSAGAASLGISTNDD